MSSPQMLLQSHEDRLQKVSEDLNETREKVSAVDIHVQHLGDDAKAQHDELMKRLETLFDSIDARLTPIESKINKVVEAQDTYASDLKKLQIAEANRTKRNKKIRAAAIGLIITAATGLAAKGGDWLWTILTANR